VSEFHGVRVPTLVGFSLLTQKSRTKVGTLTPLIKDAITTGFLFKSFTIERKI